MHTPSTGPRLTTIPARCGTAARMSAGQHVRVINTHGQQVVDTWAYAQSDPGEFMSMEHSRGHIGTIFPSTGSVMRTNRRRPILSFVEDTSGGRHDTLIAACDRYRYQLLGCTTHHDNCTDNLATALGELGLTSERTPCPLNLFMNIPLDAGGGLTFASPVSSAGQWVTLRAEMDLVIVFSACPQDLVPVNGSNCTPTDAHFEIIDGEFA